MNFPSEITGAIFDVDGTLLNSMRVWEGLAERYLMSKGIKKLKEEDGKDIWICGGAKLVQQIINENLIDYYYITIIPTLLGSGIRLFENGTTEIKLKLLYTQAYNGMTDLVYVRR